MFDFVLDSIGFSISFFSCCCQLMRHLNTGMILFKLQFLLPSLWDTSSWSIFPGWLTQPTLFGDWIRITSNQIQTWFSLSQKGKKISSNLCWNLQWIFISYWPQYHYLLPFDYQTGEFGNYGKGTSTALCRVFAALGWISDLKTVTTDAVKKGLAKAVDTGKPVVDCLKQASEDELLMLPKEHYLAREHLD